MQKEKENINIVNYKVSDLIFAEYNPRELTKDQHQDLKDSITRFGFVDPLIVLHLLSLLHRHIINDVHPISTNRLALL